MNFLFASYCHITDHSLTILFYVCLNVLSPTAWSALNCPPSFQRDSLWTMLFPCFWSHTDRDFAMSCLQKSWRWRSPVAPSFSPLESVVVVFETDKLVDAEESSSNFIVIYRQVSEIRTSIQSPSSNWRHRWNHRSRRLRYELLRRSNHRPRPLETKPFYLNSIDQHGCHFFLHSFLLSFFQ